MTAPPNTLPAPAEDPSPEQAQERIDQTLSRLSAYRNVRGVMVLSRRVAASAAAGSAGDTENASTSTHTSTPPTNGAEGTGGIAGIVQSTGSVFEGDGGRRYAKAVEGIVLAVTRGMDECDAGDELKLMRIRTKRHELIITPDERYVLVVLQDPGS